MVVAKARRWRGRGATTVQSAANLAMLAMLVRPRRESGLRVATATSFASERRIAAARRRSRARKGSKSGGGSTAVMNWHFSAAKKIGSDRCRSCFSASWGRYFPVKPHCLNTRKNRGSRVKYRVGRPTRESSSRKNRDGGGHAHARDRKAAASARSEATRPSSECDTDGGGGGDNVVIDRFPFGVRRVIRRVASGVRREPNKDEM